VENIHIIEEKDIVPAVVLEGLLSLDNLAGEIDVDRLMEIRASIASRLLF